LLRRGDGLGVTTMPEQPSLQAGAAGADLLLFDLV
jgi:hypothetical protein